MNFIPNKLRLLCIIVNFLPFETVTTGPTYHGMRLGDFPAPDFKHTIQSVHVQNNKESFKRVSLPSFTSVPDLVRVYASTQDGDSAGFRFEGTGACQNPGSSGNYGGIIFAYNSKEVRLWVPTKYSGNTNGKLIYVEDGWGGEKYTQSSRTADVTVEVWKNLITPNFQTDVQVDTSKSFYEIPHKLKQIPDFISVRVYARNSNSFDKNYLYHFHAAGATQSMSGSTEFGGVVFSYNETFVRLWLPNTGNGLKTSCILITKGWGNGKYSKDMNSQTCQVEIRAWINAFPNPAFQTKWKRIRANAHQKSFREISHNIGTDALLVQVQVKEQGLSTDGFVYEGLGSIQSTQSAGETYGGLLFAYDKSRIRIWAPSSDSGEKGRALFVSSSWGNGTHTVKHDKAFFRVRIYAHKCSNDKQILDGQGLCRDAGQTGLVWKTSTWGNCSRTCSNGFQERKLSGCHAVDLETVLSCNFENNGCGFTNVSNFKWERSRGSAEKITDLDGLTQPPSGFEKGSWFLYSVIQDLHGGSLVELQSPRIAARKSCYLRFYYNTGVYYNHFAVKVLHKGHWYEKWKMSDKQPGNPYIWYSGYLNLDFQEVEYFRFSLRLRNRCRKDCGYVALDDITLQCEAEKTNTLPLAECQKRAIPIPGCNIDALQPVHKGPAYSIAVTVTGTYARAKGKLSDHIATYQFKVEMDGYYHIWLDVLGTNSRDNGVFYIVNDSKQTKVNLIVKKGQPIWNRLDRQDLYLDSGSHLLLLMQYEYGFTYRNIIVAPRTLVSWSPLGMQNLHISDQSFKCSLQLGPDHQEKNSLIRLNGQGAWETDDANDDWLHWQIVFPDLALVNKVAIQGGCREPRDPVCCSADRFKLKFSLDGKYYSSYRNSTVGEHMFPGSHRTAPHYVVVADLEYAVPARGIRFYPFQPTLALTCLRVEVYGTYITKSMCTNTGLKPDLIRTCVGDRKCGKNAHCSPDQAAKPEGKDREVCQCLPGHHGPSCEFVGCNPNPCQKNGVCKLQDGSFKCFCSPGYTGKLCQLSCPSYKFGPGCNENCTCSGRSHCHPVTGQCVCDRGYTGEKCNEPCTEGYYGENCERVCRCSSLTFCDSVTGSCSCPLGFTGELCEKPCQLSSYGKNCSMTCRCSRHAKCLPENGTCVCPPGWSGKYCEHECQDGKFGIGCRFDCNCSSNSLCNKVNGICSCKPGFIGKRCDQKCPQGYYGMDCIFRCNCDRRRTVSCHHEKGCVCKVGAVGKRCEKDCKTGRYGPNCKQKCNCQNDAPCDSKDGTCYCPVGFIGKFCDSICPTGRYGRNCSGVCNCISNQTDVCNYQDGTCECMPGYKGKKCHKTCKTGTWGKNCEFQCYCYNEAYCDPFNGLCSCLSGWQGESCETPCDNGFFGPGCKHKCKCQNGAFCDRFNGRCTCASGFVGEYCSEVCPKWKYGKKCKVQCSCVKDNSFGCGNINGSCFCNPGYQGITCQQSCNDGKYGHNCKYDCPSCPYHVTAACNKVTGRCRCAAGYLGERCQEYCPLDRYGILCESKCNCTASEFCNNIDGTCFSKEMHEFFLSFRFLGINSINDVIRQNLTLNIEKFMAKYFQGFLLPKSSRQRRESNDVTTVGDGGSFEGLIPWPLSDVKNDIGIHGASVPGNGQDSGEMQHNFVSVKSYQEGTESDSTSKRSEIISELKQILSGPIKQKDHSFDVLAQELADIYLLKQKNIQTVPVDSIHTDRLERIEFSESINPENLAASGDKTDYSNVMFTTGQKVYRSFYDVGFENSKFVKDSIWNRRPDVYIHDIVRREAINKTDSSSCVLVVSAKIVNSYSVRVTQIEEKYDEQGKPVANVGFVALRNGKPLSKDVMKSFMNIIPKDCLLEGVGCGNCAYYGGKLYEKTPVQSPFTLWVIIGAVTGGVLLILAFALCLIVQRRRHNIAPTIYKVKKNSRDIELRPCLGNGEGGHVLAFENPYYDVIAAMGLDDDIEEDYYNPLYTYDDVSLYCDDQATDSETETNNEDGYQYPYDRDSGISSGTIHQG